MVAGHAACLSSGSMLLRAGRQALGERQGGVAKMRAGSVRKRQAYAACARAAGMGMGVCGMLPPCCREGHA